MKPYYDIDADREVDRAAKALGAPRRRLAVVLMLLGLPIFSFGALVIGLGWGLLALWVFAFQALRPGDFPYSPEINEGGDRA